MADLIDRLAGTQAMKDAGREKINLHRFMGAEQLYAFGVWDRAALVSEFGLDGDEVTQAAQLADEIDGQSNATNRALYIIRVNSVLMCLEDNDDRLYHNPDGSINRTKIYGHLQITG